MKKTIPCNKTWFVDEFARRCEANPRYSTRAFARDLGISKSSLAEFLQNKRNLSLRTAKKVAIKLCLSPMQTRTLLTGLGYVHDTAARSEISDDTFHLISDWYYLAILNLGGCEKSSADSKRIARRLGIPHAVANAALQRLVRLNLLTIENGCLVRTSTPIDTSNDVPSSAIREHHRQVIQRACESLDRVDVSKRHFETLSMALDPKRVSKLKELIRKFTADFEEKATGGRKSEVYNLSLQFFPCSVEE